MIDFDKYTNTGRTVVFPNGKEFTVYSKSTKKGTRYYYWSSRMFPLSKLAAGVL